MHYFKLFLAATFAVSAGIKTAIFLAALYATSLVQPLSQFAGVRGSLLGGLFSMLAGALIAKQLHFRRVPKAHHN